MPTLVGNEAYWDEARKAKVDRNRLVPIPEAPSRLVALRAGQLDWIEVPAHDGIPSLKQAGLTTTTGSYPHGCARSSATASIATASA